MPDNNIVINDERDYNLQINVGDVYLCERGKKMIYIPMLKTRKAEMDVAEDSVNCFSDNIIPLFEILQDEYRTRYITNPISGEFVYEKRGKSMRRVKIQLDSDIITLDSINESIQGKVAFVDYFRFSIQKYKKSIDITGSQLAWKLSQDEALYKNHIKGISAYPNFYPVISIKREFLMDIKELDSFISETQESNSNIALRITDDYIKKYKDLIRTKLRASDFLLFDIGEQNPCSKIMEYNELKDINTQAKIILLNSPRKASINNGSYPIDDLTDLIDCSAKDIAVDRKFSGYGDYCGLKDALPTKGGSNGTGSAIALFYDYAKNKFHSYVHSDTSEGVRGYRYLVPIILSQMAVLDPDGDCPAINTIKGMSGSGNWSTWHKLNASRYIYQVFKHERQQ